MKFSIEDFFSKCDQIGRKLQIWSHLPRKYLMENFIFLGSVRVSIILYEMMEDQAETEWHASHNREINNT